MYTSVFSFILSILSLFEDKIKTTFTHSFKKNNHNITTVSCVPELHTLRHKTDAEDKIAYVNIAANAKRMLLIDLVTVRTLLFTKSDTPRIKTYVSFQSRHQSGKIN